MSKTENTSALMGYVEGNIPRDKIDNRGVSQYINLLFQDERKENQPEQVYQFVMEDEGEVGIKPVEPDLPFNGGLKEFFADGSRVLDLGSGVGNATNQLNDIFSESNVSIVGADISIPNTEDSKDEPNLVGADFKNLPFSNNSMNRIMAVETFPRWYGDYPASMRASRDGFGNPEEELYAPDDEGLLELQREKLFERIDKTWEEIHRVAAEGCIFRGTIDRCRNEESHRRQAWKFKYLIENGWEVIIYSEEDSHHTNFIAYLPEKKTD